MKYSARPGPVSPSPEGESVRDWLYRRIVEGTPDAVVFADPEGVIRLWNAGAQAIFGYSAEEAIGQTLDLIVPEKLRERHWEGYRHAVETGASSLGGEMLKVPAVTKGGDRISLEFTVALVRDPDGDLQGVAAVIRDVTERWQGEKVLKERLAALEAELEASRGSG
jgi:PAS domain S-box-containing protein